jgi:Xaa-Pro aminopeptidase
VIQFAELKIDALLVSALPNIRYLSGFTGSHGLLLVTPDSQTLFTDPRYTIQASQECSSKVKTVAKGPLELAAVEMIRRSKLKRIGFESTRMIYDAFERASAAVYLQIPKLLNPPCDPSGRGSLKWPSPPSLNSRCAAWAPRKPRLKPS